MRSASPGVGVRRFRPYVLVLSTTLAASCTGSSGDGPGQTSEGDTEVDPEPIPPGDSDGSADPLNPDLYDGGAYWRIDVTKTFSSDTIDIGEIVFIEIAPGEHDPVPSVAGDHMVIAYAGDAVHSARPVHFANAGRAETALEGGGMELEVIAIDVSPATVFVPFDEQVTRVEIQDGTGAVLAEVFADDLPTTSFRSFDNPVSAKYPHIAVFGAEDWARLPTAYFVEGKIESVLDPTAEHYATLVAELDRVSPAVRSAITAIAVVDPPDQGCISVGSGDGGGCGYDDNGTPKVTPSCAAAGLAATDANGNPLPTGQFSGGALGSYIILNAYTYPWSGTIVHEATHNFNNLLDGRQAEAAMWSPAVVAEAGKLVRDFRLGTNFSQTWFGIHLSAWEADPGQVGQPVPPGQIDHQWCDRTLQQAVNDGFATPYASSTTYEDIAEYVATVIVEGAAAPVCAQFAGQAGGDFPEDLAVPYAKLALLRQLGALTRDQFEDCVHGVEIGRTSQGIELNGQVFTSDLKAGFYESNGTRYFAILGQGVEQWQLLYEASVEEGESPLGVHKFGSISGLSLALFGIPDNGAYLNHPDTPRASDSGLLIITEASAERVTGAVLHLSLQNAFGVDTSYDAYAPFLIGAPP